MSRLIRHYTSMTFLVVALIAVITSAATPRSAAAHPLGNFTVNQYTRIEVASESLRLVYVLDMAEIPAFQERQQIDANNDGTVDEAESNAYLARSVPEIIDQMTLLVSGDEVPLESTAIELTFPEGQGGLSLLRLRLILEPEPSSLLTTTAKSIDFRNDFATDRLGWREIVVTHGSGVGLTGVDVPATDSTNELRSYPDELLKSPLDQRVIEFDARLAPGPAAPGYAAFVASDGPAQDLATRPDGGASGARFASLLDRSDSTTIGLILTLLAAMLWGAAHALSPGHGKTIVGAYLVGSRGTPRHAAFLGLTVTITHTAGVIALGLVTLFASNYILPEQLFPWISVFSGLTIITLGLWTLQARLRGGSGLGHQHHHSHDHDHDHGQQHGPHTHIHDGHSHSHLLPEGQRLSLRSLVALGVSGGILPCPSALVVLLGSIALGRVGYGLALVLAFSFGLALTLTSVGLAFLYAGKLLDSRISGGGRIRFVFRYGPALGSFALVVAGTLIILRALSQTGIG